MIVIERLMTRGLRGLLFKPSDVCTGGTLFEQFEEDVQQQIKISLGRMSHPLEEALELLQAGDGAPEENTQLSISSLTSQHTRNPSPTHPWETLPNESISDVKWSLQDKERTRTILEHYRKLNRSVRDQVELWCLASKVSSDYSHLKRLGNSKYAKQLGFSSDASLQIAVATAIEMDGAFRLDPQWGDILKEAVPVETKYALVKHGGKSMLVEYPDVYMTDPLARPGFDALASLLSHPKERIFRIPKCIGWDYVPVRHGFGLLFEIPEGRPSRPKSLLLQLDSEIPTLGQRVQLALALSMCIAQLHMVKWEHKQFRSENILLFPQERTSDQAQEEDAPTRDYSTPSVLGFELSKPVLDPSSSLGRLLLSQKRLSTSTATKLSPEVFRQNPRHLRFRQLPPTNSKLNQTATNTELGVVLLEIGLWQKATTLLENNTRYGLEIQAQLLKQARRGLGKRMGEKYQNVVISCLTRAFGVDVEANLELQQAFRAQVVDVLDRIADAV